MGPRKPEITRKAAHKSFIAPRTTATKTKQSISVAGIFKRVPANAEVVGPRILQHRSFIATSSSMKHYPRLIKAPEHSLTLDFTDTTSSYCSDLLREATIALEKSHLDLVKRLNNESGEDHNAQPHDGSDITAATTTLKAKSKQASMPISRQIVHVKHHPRGSREVITRGIPLSERMEAFATIVETKQKIFNKHQTDYHNTMNELQQLVAEMRCANGAPQERRGSLSYSAIQSALDEQVKAIDSEIKTLGIELLALLEKQRKKEISMKKELVQFLESKYA